MVFRVKSANHYIKVSWLIAVLGLSQGCSTCVSRIVDSSNQGELTAELAFRKCGTYAGYSVAIYTQETGPIKSGEGVKEPFKAVYRSENSPVSDVLPISIEWIGEKVLLIRQQTRTGLDDHVHDLVVIKAENKYMDVKIEYEPDPVIWE